VLKQHQRLSGEILATQAAFGVFATEVRDVLQFVVI